MNIYKFVRATYWLTRLLSIAMVLSVLAFCSNAQHSANATPSTSVKVAKDSVQLIEIVVNESDKDVQTMISRLCTQYHLPLNSLYKWQDHYVIYTKLPIPGKLINDLKGSLPGSDVRLYPKPFYNFNRSYCSNSNTAKEWDNIILTADLVADTAMQHQCLQYHATQFEKWPEVGQGFCHANFQQLLVFRNGKQLMLIISIPKGESLDKLNPKTTENNPKVVEWNNIMKKYQEGIPGTKPGEVWVFLKPIR